jgi:hypothetical protein
MIESFGFKDCAVILSSVDSMESMNGGIVIQVLGELSNDGAPSQKFAQTFFLASLPPSGYFVLNNIFRYLKEDIDSDFEDVEPDSANEMDTSASHNNIDSEHLTNGFYSTPHPVVSEEDRAAPMDLPVSSVPIISSLNTLSESGHVAHVDEGNRDEPPVDIATDETITSADATASDPLTFTHHDMVSTVDESSPADPHGDLSSQAAEQVQSVEPSRTLATPSNPVTKTWATMAATNTAKWTTQNTEQKPATGGTASRTKAAGSSTIPRKEATKPSQPGICTPLLP